MYKPQPFQNRPSPVARRVDSIPTFLTCNSAGNRDAVQLIHCGTKCWLVVFLAAICWSIAGSRCNEKSLKLCKPTASLQSLRPERDGGLLMLLVLWLGCWSTIPPDWRNTNGTRSRSCVNTPKSIEPTT